MMAEPVCPVCGGVLVGWVQKMGRAVFRCRACGHITVPAGIVRRSDGLSIYESQDSIFEADGNHDYYLDETNHDAARAKADYVASHCPSGARLLDVGASYGHFLAAAATRFDAAGLEVSPAAVAWGRATFGVSVRVGSVYEPSPDREGAFDAVTLWDVIEHLEMPGAAIEQVRRWLKPDGLLFLSTPDAGSLAATLMGPRWHYLDPIQHLNLFSRANLTRLLADHGLVVVDHCHFGRSYRATYVVNRLAFLWRGRPLLNADRLAGLPGWMKSLTLPVKLWDVMGLVARRVR